MSTMTVSRRSFLKVSALAGGGLMLGFDAISKSMKEESASAAEGAVFSPNAWLKIDSQGVVTLMAPNPEGDEYPAGQVFVPAATVTLLGTPGVGVVIVQPRLP